MTADFPVVLDACVLVPAALRDTLLRCGERRLFLPRWSGDILDELRRTLLEKISRSQEQVEHLLTELNQHFADSRVEGYEPLVALMANDPADRHVVAAAVKCGAEAIITFNLKHFPEAALDPWDIEVQHPDEFLVDLYHLNSDLIIHILYEQAGFIGRTLADLLAVLRQGVPNFVHLVGDSLDLANL
ncbi:MAG: PIN domain-containing protein [Acidobacteria bacterium]|nr:MAG: PIN domain-containing protein [Acidobacteriota bacterium]